MKKISTNIPSQSWWFYIYIVIIIAILNVNLWYNNVTSENIKNIVFNSHAPIFDESESVHPNGSLTGWHAHETQSAVSAAAQRPSRGVDRGLVVTEVWVVLIHPFNDRLLAFAAGHDEPDDEHLQGSTGGVLFLKLEISQEVLTLKPKPSHKWASGGHGIPGTPALTPRKAQFPK